MKRVKSLKTYGIVNSFKARKTISRAEPKCSGKSQLQQYMHVFSPQINVIACYITPVDVTTDLSLI